MGVSARDPVEDHAVIGDRRAAALVGSDGWLDWLCAPLTGGRAGTWLIAPGEGGRCARRRYRGDSLVLETEWITRAGVVRVVDAMPSRGDVSDLVRLVEGVSGVVPMRMDLELRFDGAAAPWMRQVEGHMAAVAGPDAAWLTCPVHVTEQEGGRIAAEFAVRRDDSLAFVLTHAASHRPRPLPVDGRAAVRAAQSAPPDVAARELITSRGR